MAEIKTRENDGDVEEFLNAIEHDTRRADAIVLRKLMQKVTGLPARMWGASIVGFGRYHYRYESGREGDYLRTGFSPRKQNMVVYVMPGYADYGKILKRLGKHRIGKSCLYINRLSDIELSVLEELVSVAFEQMNVRYPN